MNGNSVHQETRKYRGVRCRKWGKWVSEIRVPATRERLWLGSYATPEAAAVAHDIASYCLRGPSSMNRLNFPHHLMQLLPATVRDDMSPSSIQRAASDAGMAVDAQLVLNELQPACRDGGHTMEVDDMEREGIIQGMEISEVNYESGGILDVSIDDYDHIYCLDVSIDDYDHIY